MRNTLTIAAIAIFLAGCNGAAGGPNGTKAASVAPASNAPAAPGSIAPESLNSVHLQPGASAATPWTPGSTPTTATGTGSIGVPLSQATNSVTSNGTTQTTVSGTPSTGLPAALSGSLPGSQPTGTTPTTSGGLPPALSGSLPGASSAASSSAPSDSHVAYALNAINTSRATQGLPPYTLDGSMSSCALRHSQDCYNCTGGDESQFGSCAHKDVLAGDTCGGNAENQGVAGPGDQDQAFQQVHDGMMGEGPGGGHYDALMNVNYTTVGIGLYVDPNGIVWVSEEFK